MHVKVRCDLSASCVLGHVEVEVGIEIDDKKAPNG